MLSKTHFSRIRSLQLKKNRDAEGKFIAEGSKVVMELIRSGKFLCEELVAAPDWLNEQGQLLSLAQPIRISTASPEQLTSLSLLKKNEDVFAVFRRSPVTLPPAPEGIVVLLDGIRDPGNLGTIIRAADWFGLHAVICSQDTVDGYNPKVIQSAMGSTARVAVHHTDLLQWLSAYPRFPVLAAVPGGRPFREINTLRDVGLLIGSESHGICGELLARASGSVGIPGRGKAESLNAAVAAGILLSHFTA